MIKLIVGLGNPGVEYELTRHNIAWILMDSFDILANQIWKSKFKGEYAEFKVGSQKLYALKPLTYMNLSGESVGALCKFFKIQPAEILVLQDEIDLPFGQIHFKQGGGLAGHNGLKSISQHLGTNDYFRLRLGVGRPPRGSVSSWVLSKFPPNMDTDLSVYMEKASIALSVFLEQGFKKASTEYNKKDLLKI